MFKETKTTTESIPKEIPKKEMQKKPKSGKIRIFFGYLCSVFGLIYLIMALAEAPPPNNETANPIGGFIALALIFGGGGILLLISGYRAKARAKRFKKQNQPKIPEAAQHTKEIPEAAQNIKEIPKVANNTVKQVINVSFVATANIDESTGKAAPQSKTVVVTCPGCGAKNIATVGQINKCEYCTSLLEH